MATDSPIALDSTLGCLFLAGIFSAVLWGMAFIQLYLYYENSSKFDGRAIKSYVFLVFTLVIVFQAIFLQSLYVCLVKNFGNLAALYHPQRHIVDCDIIGSFVVVLVQASFLMRLWYLSGKNHALAGLLSMPVLSQFAITVTYFGQIYHISDSLQLLHFLATERSGLILLIVSDAAIALALSILLFRLRSGVQKTDSIMNQLIIYTITTGLVTCIWGVIGLIGTYLVPNGFVYLLVDLVFPTLYLNCLLASLNSRSRHRNDLASNSGLVSINLNSTGRDVVERANSAVNSKDSSFGTMQSGNNGVGQK